MGTTWPKGAGEVESLDYKHADYLSRSKDKYAMAKYGIIMTWLPRRENISVLNAGCGSGELNIMLSQNPTWRVEALDSDAWPWTTRANEGIKPPPPQNTPKKSSPPPPPPPPPPKKKKKKKKASA